MGKLQKYTQHTTSVVNTLYTISPLLSTFFANLISKTQEK